MTPSPCHGEIHDAAAHKSVRGLAGGVWGLDCAAFGAKFRLEGEFGGSRMRTLALAAVIGVGLTVGGVASAEQWNDPNGRLTFDRTGFDGVREERVRPNPDGSPSQTTAVSAFNARSDCYFFSVPNSVSANSSAGAVRNTTTALPAADWVRAANTVTNRLFFPSPTAALTSQSVDTSHFWPIQRAELAGATAPIYAAIQARPGLELRAFCRGATSASAYDALFASLGHPNDATWQGQANEQAAARAAQEQAAAEAAAQQAATQEQAGQQPEQQEEGRRRRNRDPSRDH